MVQMNVIKFQQQCTSNLWNILIRLSYDCNVMKDIWYDRPPWDSKFSFNYKLDVTISAFVIIKILISYYNIL